MALARMEHTGAAPATGLAVSMASGDTSFTVVSGTGYPTGAVGNFIICIDPGTATEEKILCSARSGAVFTVAGSGRGYDGTSAQGHNTGITNVQHVLGAIEVDDDNDHVYTTTRDDHTQYARTDGTRAITGAQSFNSTITVASGVTVTSGGETITAGGLTVTAGGLTVSAGTTAVQALTATTIAGTGAVTGVTSVTGTGEFKGTDFWATGTTGAASATRLAGATSAGGPPTTGTFNTGDVVVDQKYGVEWICTSGGSPGTWVANGCGNLYALVYRNGAWTTGGNAEIAFDTALSDPNSMVNLTTGTATLPIAGLYQVTAQYRYTAGAVTDDGAITIIQNSTVVAFGTVGVNAVAAGDGWAGATCLVVAAASDTIKVNSNTSVSGKTGITGQGSTFMHLKLAA